MANANPWTIIQDQKTGSYSFLSPEGQWTAMPEINPGDTANAKAYRDSIRKVWQADQKGQAATTQIDTFGVGAHQQQEQLRSGLGQLLKESAIPAAGGLAGLIAGGIPGAVVGGAGGEAINQALGLSKPDPAMIAVSGAVEALPIVGRTLKAGAKKVARAIPGVKAVMKQDMVRAMEALPAQYRPARSSKELYGELSQLGEVNVKFDDTLRTMEQLGIKEEGIIPGFQSAELKRATRGAEEVLSSAVPEQRIPGRTNVSPIIDDLGRPITREIPEQVIPGRPDQGVPFEIGQNNLRRLGARIQAAESGITQEDVGALRQIRRSMLNDMDRAAEHLPKLQEANKTFKREMALEDLQSIISRNIKPVEGKDNLFDINSREILSRLRLLTNKANPRDYDRLFEEGLGENTIKEVVQAFNKINDFGRITFNIVGPASLVTQGALGYAGAQIGQATGIPGAGLAGTLAGASLPYLISESLTRPNMRPLVMRLLKESSGKVTKPEMIQAVLAAGLARSPRLQEE